MSNTRTSTSPGVFADDALTTIPGTPTVGVAYRDLTTTQADSEAGLEFATVLESSKFNQIMHELSALVKILDTRGVLGWCDAVDYTQGAYVVGSDNNLYRASNTSGPASSVKDPVSEPLYWTRFGGVAASSAEVLAGVEANKFVSPATLIAGLLGLGVMNADGFARLPFRDGGGIRRELLIQWGSLNIPGVEGDYSTLFPSPYTNACLHVFSVADAGGATSCYETDARVLTYGLTGATWRMKRIGDTEGPIDPVNLRYVTIGW